MQQYTYQCGGGNCPVVLTDDLNGPFSSLNGRNVVIIGDSKVMGLYGAQVAATLSEVGARMVRSFSFRPGEKSKSVATWQRLLAQLARTHVDRQTVVIGLGGGVSTDLAGFVAASYMRGVPLWLLPTSLLGMVDAAIGAKTAINSPYGKNLIGAFYVPQKVVINPNFLKTLPRAEWVNGAAEVVKIAFILDHDLFEKLETLEQVLDIDSAVLARAVELKCQIVSWDGHDCGVRQLLNFGHTVGHALEKATRHLSHGQAVAVGQVVAARLAVRRGLLAADNLERLEKLLCRFGLPINPPVTLARAGRFMSHDKKNLLGEIRMVLPQDIGHSWDEGGYTHAVTIEELAGCWE